MLPLAADNKTTDHETTDDGLFFEHLGALVFEHVGYDVVAADQDGFLIMRTMILSMSAEHSAWLTQVATQMARNFLLC